MRFRPSEYAAEISTHYQRCWGSLGEPLKLVSGPVNDLGEDFRVLRFPPSQSRDMWTYATQCMSAPEHAEPLEIHMFSSIADDGLVEILTAVAHYHRTGTALGANHTVNFGQPWSGASLCTHGYLSLPYLDGPALERLDCGNAQVRFLWMIPVTPGEIAYLQKHGVEEFEARLEASDINYLDVTRPSCI